MEVDNSRMFLARVVRVVTMPKDDPPAGPAIETSRPPDAPSRGSNKFSNLGGA
ncbi:hypothetical protein [Nocardia abscessus]|uniref:Uncharacterized protein n=1 Tax=Nocardia abscessus TaxID=120957 RepID=A0ABS0C135_9NOCA|nr:hypothetical protein [Nocardia abscessus]MBF6224095.1 hypothetical protein [Nocardia abscessus]